MHSVEKRLIDAAIAVARAELLLREDREKWSVLVDAHNTDSSPVCIVSRNAIDEDEVCELCIQFRKTSQRAAHLRLRANARRRAIAAYSVFARTLNTRTTNDGAEERQCS